MGGHSHWAGIKHKKALVDAKKGKVFTKILREITIAAKMSGGNPDQNPRLRKAIDDARAANMPSDNVKRAIMKGTGQLPGVSYEESLMKATAPVPWRSLWNAPRTIKTALFPKSAKFSPATAGPSARRAACLICLKTKGLL